MSPQVREAARQVTTAQAGRGDAEGTRARRPACRQNEKRLAVGLSDSSTWSRRSATCRPADNELAAIIAYNRALIDFEAVQPVPPGE